MTTFFVLAEPKGDGFTTTSLELLSAAAERGSVTAVTYAESATGLDALAARYGASSLIVLTGLGAQLPSAPVAKALAALVANHQPDAVLFPASYDGRDIAGRLSARLDRPVLTNVTGLGADLTTEHPLFGGTQIAHAAVTSPGVALIVVRPKSFAAAEREAAAAAVTTAALDGDATTATTITDTTVATQRGPALEDAAIVVSGGRGLGQAAAFSMIEELAGLLNGAAGASRAIVDAGWVPYALQVGQTGQTVKPTVYIACGISGATQHLVGMKGSQHIVAINKDPDAPIFQSADFGVVGDVATVLPALIELVRARRNA